jgi:hypothetical protein
MTSLQQSAALVQHILHFSAAGLLANVFISGFESFKLAST